MKNRRICILFAALIIPAALLFWKPSSSQLRSLQKKAQLTEGNSTANTKTNPAILTRGRQNQDSTPHDAMPPSPPRATNSYTIVHSNVVVNVVIVDGPMESLIGTDRYEQLARQSFEDAVESEPHLRRIRDLIEAEHPGSDRLYSAVRIVYETRSEVLNERHNQFDLDFSSNARLGQIQADPNVTEEQRNILIQGEINEVNAQKLAGERQAQDNTNRMLQHLKTLVGGLSEDTLERFAAFEPRFSPGRLNSPQPRGP